MLRCINFNNSNIYDCSMLKNGTIEQNKNNISLSTNQNFTINFGSSEQ